MYNKIMQLDLVVLLTPMALALGVSLLEYLKEGTIHRSMATFIVLYLIFLVAVAMLPSCSSKEGNGVVVQGSSYMKPQHVEFDKREPISAFQIRQNGSISGEMGGDSPNFRFYDRTAASTAPSTSQAAVEPSRCIDCIKQGKSDCDEECLSRQQMSRIHGFRQ